MGLIDKWNSDCQIWAKNGTPTVFFFYKERVVWVCEKPKICLVLYLSIGFFFPAFVSPSAMIVPPGLRCLGGWDLLSPGAMIESFSYYYGSYTCGFFYIAIAFFLYQEWRLNHKYWRHVFGHHRGWIIKPNQPMRTYTFTPWGFFTTPGICTKVSQCPWKSNPDLTKL